jgi:hypothetical protein
MCNANALEDFMGEEVVEVDGKPVGTLACYWEREQRKALLLGVDIPGRSGHTHVVPAQGARLNERQTYVQVSFASEKLIQAPCLDCECELDEAFEQRIWAFYGLPVPRPEAPDLLSQRAEATRQQLRRIVRPETLPPACAPSPAACAAPAAEAHPSAPGLETSAISGVARPVDVAPCEARESRLQEALPGGSCNVPWNKPAAEPA